MIFWILGGIALFLFLTLLGILLYCYKRVFYYQKRRPLAENEYGFPQDAAYKKHGNQLIAWAKAYRELPHEELSITSFDNLTLKANYYECQKGAPIEIMLNGYRGNAERDMAGGIERCFKLKRNALLVNQRACGNSEGKSHTFGINEKRDLLKWIDFCIKKFGNDCQLILTGISMGGATVLLACRESLPPNVKYALADCPYSSAKEVICKVIDEMGLPSKVIYPFVKLSGRIIGRFNVEEDTPLNAVKNATVPIILFHGDEDTIVPCEMSKRLFNACKTDKYLHTVKGCEHGLAYPEDKEGYLLAIKEFEKQINCIY